MDILSLVITKLGNTGPVILFIIANFLLWNKSTMWFYYNIGFLFNAILNTVIKGILKFPRPSEDPKEFNLAIKNGHHFIFKNGIPHDIFGMPSGHSQAVFFTTFFIYLALKKYKITLYFFLFSLLVIYQRVKDNYHTPLQVLCGSIAGALFAYLIYFFAQQSLKGVVREKPDDNGPI